MKQTRKIMVAILMIAIALVSLCACGNESEKSKSANSDESMHNTDYVSNTNDDTSDERKEFGWEISGDTLYIWGQCDMPDYEDGDDNITPWKDSIFSKVVIQEGITHIGDYAFYECERIESVVLPETVVDIGKGSFYGCESLNELNIPETVKMIDDEAFGVCVSLEEICLPFSIILRNIAN